MRTKQKKMGKDFVNYQTLNILISVNKQLESPNFIIHNTLKIVCYNQTFFHEDPPRLHDTRSVC